MERLVQFGQKLREERLQRGISLEEVARCTKIRRVHLESLEEGRPQDLPSSDMVVVGFLRTYAHHLRMDEDLLLAAYREASGTPAPVSPAPQYLRVPLERRWHIWPVLLGAILLAGGWSAFWLIQHRGAPMPPRPSQAPAREVGAASSNAPTPVAAPAEPAPDPAGEVMAVAESPADTQDGALPEPDALGPLQLPPSVPPETQPEPKDRRTQPASGDLVIEVAQPCWMEIWQGPSRVVYRLVESGEHISLNGTEFTVTLGNREAASVRWKGVALPPPSGEGMVVSRWKIPPQAGEEARNP